MRRNNRVPSRFDPQKHHRRSIRLKGYEYSQPGAYFVTVVAYQCESLFGKVVNGEMKSNEYGKIVQKWWDEISNHFPNIETIPFVIMPNHIHEIIVIAAERRGMVSVPGVHEQVNAETANLGGGCPYRRQHWDRLLPISNINPQKI